MRGMPTGFWAAGTFDERPLEVPLGIFFMGLVDLVVGTFFFTTMLLVKRPFTGEDERPVLHTTLDRSRAIRREQAARVGPEERVTFP